VSVSQCVTQNELNAYRSRSSTDLHQTCHQGRIPGGLVIVFGGNPKDACLPNRKWN